MRIGVFLLFWSLSNTSLANDAEPLNQCQSAIKSRPHSEALKTCLHSLEAQQNKSSPVTIQLWLELADLYSQQGLHADTDYYLAKIKQSEFFLSNTEVQYRWNRLVGLKLLHQTKYEQAKEYLHQGYKIAKNESNKEWLAKSSNDLGLIHFKQLDYKNALLYYKESLKHKEAIGNLYYIGTTLNNLGLLNKDMGDIEQSISYYEQALQTYLDYTQLDDFDVRVFSNISHLYEDLAVIYALSGNNEKQNQYIDKIIATFSTKLSNNEKVRALKNLALVHIKQKQSSEARKFIDKARKFAGDDSNYLDEIYYIEAYISYLEKNYEQAISLVNTAISHTKEHSKPRVLSDSHQLLYTIYEQRGQYQKAFEHLNKHYQYKEQELQAQYQSDFQLIKQQISKERLERQLVTEQLANEKQSNRIRSLSNIILASLIILLALAFLVIFLVYRKRKEKQALLASIKSHKEKLLLLESEALQEKDSLEDKNSEQKSLLAERFDDEACTDEQFRQSLVELLIETVNLWEKASQLDRIELAEKSRIWRVSIDEGRLRTRSLDKYLNIQKIPQNPRWRNVVKTSHYVLAECELSQSDRALLEDKLEQVMSLIKARSMEHG
ncbi:tetratricopeptide repeat protein [Kangiella koreensis]|uniref:TPR repeat-containing protein n=1 Tax=Kangiella koreensis (strain DSM 16069 / JCM 12317 / KCTC 12182 / SW-125) TaxID=523791 RepID=C7RCL6_KANKD|nr:tetratricopeptide repeat protein [Kangiella koreensis]ACV27008.1 TPR repeat-containing protein [Kangiella koreensis DSM 16069]